MKNAALYGSVQQRYEAHEAADGVNRADANLRHMPFREGDAVFCRKCDGNGYFMNPLRVDPMKCSRCGGEGLEPK